MLSIVRRSLNYRWSSLSSDDAWSHKRLYASARSPMKRSKLEYNSVHSPQGGLVRRHLNPSWCHRYSGSWRKSGPRRPRVKRRPSCRGWQRLRSFVAGSLKRRDEVSTSCLINALLGYEIEAQSSARLIMAVKESITSKRVPTMLDTSKRR